jgi:phage-related baseplate assembly protein
MVNIDVVDSLSFDEILAEITAKLPTEITLLESDPAAKILEIVAFREMILRERINNAAKANLLAFAGGNDLDYLAEFYGVERQEGESDDSFRLRIKARIAAFSNAGSKEHYRFHTLSSSPHVKDALASSPDPGVVKISILSDSEDGRASEELLETVKNYINRDDIKMLTDTVQVVSCNIIPLDVVVEIRASNTLALQAIRSNFIEKFNASKALGWSPSISWIIANLFTNDVTHIKVIQLAEDLPPAADAVIASDECVALNSVTFV